MKYREIEIPAQGRNRDYKFYGSGASMVGGFGGGGGDGGGGSFLDKYFSFDEANDALVANVNLVSEKEIAAYFADGSIPSIFDNFPFATSDSIGGIKASSTYQNGIRINASGFLEIDPSYADSGVSSWNDLTNRPAWLTPTTKVLFEAGHGHTWSQITSKPTTFPPTAHNHIIGDITGLQGALDGKLAIGATAYNSDRLGGLAANLYPRKSENAIVTGAWIFRGNPAFSNIDEGAGESMVRFNKAGNINGLLRKSGIYLDIGNNGYKLYSESSGAYGSNPSFIIETHTGLRRFLIDNFGKVGIGTTEPTKELHVVGNGLFTGNLTANNGTFTNSIGLGSGLITYDPIKDTIRFNKTVVSDFDIVAFTDSGQSLPSIFDNLPKTSKDNFGVVKVGAGINVSGGVISLDIGSIAPQTLSFNGVDNKLSISGGNTVDLSGLTPDLTGYATENWVQLGFKPIAYQPTWGQITGKPSTFAPSVHNHIIGDVTGLQGALDGKEPSFTKNTAFNKNFGVDAGTVAQGNDSRINNGQTAYGWGNHALFNYATKQNLDDLEIGGRNLLEKTNQGADGWGWSLGTSGASATAESMEEDGVKTVRLTRNTVENSSWSFIRYNYIGREKYKPNTEYTLSFFVKASVSTYFTGARLQRTNGTDPIIVFSQVQIRAVAGEWSRIVFKGTSVKTLPSTTDQIVYLSGMNSSPGVTYQVKDLKLEKGSIVTDHTPAPEDVTAYVDNSILDTRSWIQNTGTAYNSARLGGVVASDYVRRNVAETVSTNWTFNGDLYSYKTIGLRTAGNATTVNLAATNSYHNQSGLLVNAAFGTTNGIGFQTSAGYDKRTLMKPNGDWDMAGNLTAQGEVTAYSSSDARLKKNIKTIESAIDIIEKLNPVQFNWNKKAIELNSAKDSDRVNYGVIAQEIERVLPELVHQTNGYKSVDYIQLIGVLLGAVKELHNEIKELKKYIIWHI